jgi:hypothetical protein
MANVKRGGRVGRDTLDRDVVTSAEPLEETPAAEVASEAPSAKKAQQELPAESSEGSITISCAIASARLLTASGEAIGGFPVDLPRPVIPVLYWVDGPGCKRRQLVLRSDSPVALDVSLRKITRRVGASVVAPSADAKRHADEIEAAIAAAEDKRGTPGFRKSPRQEVPDIKLSSRQYIRARGFRWEQSAGFLHDTKAQFGGAKKTRHEWAKLWNAYKTRPVK